MADVFKVVATAATSTNTFTFVSVGDSSTAIIRTLTICNSFTASTASCDILMSSAAGDIYVRRITSFAAASTIDAISNAVVIGPGGKMKATASPADAVHIVASYLESQ